MNVVYALGGGLGHLYRAKTFIAQLALANVKILTANPLAKKLFSADSILSLPVANTRSALADTIGALLSGPDLQSLYIDCFPSGILGELPLLPQPSCPVFTLARRLRWAQYAPLAGKGGWQLEKTYLLEPLEPQHLAFVQSQAEQITPLALAYLAPAPGNIPKALLPGPPGAPFWLVVHAFDQDECEALLHYAQEVAKQEGRKPVWVVLSDKPVPVDNGICLPYFPACDWFPLAERIFTAGGFNTMQQTRPFAFKHHALPFPRRYDDQAWRIGHYKAML